MQALALIEQAQSGAALANLARTFGITEDQARKVAEKALPEMAFAIERNTLSRAGLADLVSALGDGHHERVLEAPAVWSDPRIAADGEAILRHLLGSEAKANALASRTAQAAGLGDGLVRMLLPILAQMLMGAIARYAKGGLGDILSRLPIPGGGARPPNPQGDVPRSDIPERDRRGGFDTGGAMGDGRGFELPRSDMPAGGYPMPPIPGSAGDGGATPSPSSASRPRPGGSGLPWPTGRDKPASRPADGRGFDLPRADGAPPGGFPMPPMPPSPDGDTRQNPRAGGRGDTSEPFPLPGPGERDNPYGDLSDILRRRGAGTSGPSADSGLWSLVRSILGGALGFGGRGIFGWLVQLIVMRWGWRLLQRILLGRR
ncbi:MAG: DUF937 domain-containing protein [Hyphomicrobiaceae bacterium]